VASEPRQWFSWAWLVLLMMMGLLWALLHFSLLAGYAGFADLGDTPAFSLPFSPESTERPLAPKSTVGVAPFGHEAYLWSEAAFHYRTTLIHALDGYQDPTVLSRDAWQEYPAGIDQHRQYALMMEPVLGLAFRWFGGGGADLMGFLMAVLPLLHALLLIPLYILARTFDASRPWALLGVAVFATCSLAFAPILGAFYVKETFSWVLFSLFLLGHFRFARLGGWGWLALAGVSLWLFVGSWHLASFLVLPVLVAGVLVTVFSRGRSGVVRPLVYSLVFVAALFFPWLRARGVLLTLPSLFCFLWLGLEFFRMQCPGRSRIRWARFMMLLVGLVLIAGLGFLNSPARESYAHVGGLLQERLAHGFEKPSDPNELPFAVRVFWVPPFTSPRWAAVQAGIGWNGILLLGAIALALGNLWRRRAEGELTLSAWFFLLAFILVERLGPPMLWLGALLVAGVGASSGLRDRRWRHLWLVLLIAPLLNLGWNMGGMVRHAVAGSRGQPLGNVYFDREWPGSRAELFAWIRSETPGVESSLSGKPAVFVSEIGMGPQILLYTGRPVVLNSQFENRPIRQRYREYLDALFTTEEDRLVAFCLKYGVSHLLLNRDWATAAGRNSPKYLAGQSGPVSLEWTAARLHFQPTELSFFAPVFENDRYRVFAFEPQGVPPVQKDWGAVAGRWWNIQNFAVEQGSLRQPSADRRRQRRLDVVFQTLPARVSRTLGAEADSAVTLISLQEARARALLDMALGGPRLGMARWDELDEGIARVWRQEAGTGPGSVRQGLLGILNGSAQRPGLLQVILQVECAPREYEQVADIMVMLGEYEAAAQFYGKSGALYSRPGRRLDPTARRPMPHQEEMWQRTILFMMAGGQEDRARGLAGFCREHARPDSPHLTFFERTGR